MKGSSRLAVRGSDNSDIFKYGVNRDKELKAKQLKIDQLKHEMAILKRYRFDRRSEQMDAVQPSLLDDSTAPASSAAAHGRHVRRAPAA